MAEKNDGGDKTEKPTPKRLEDARKKGSISKSREVTSTALLVLWLALFGLAASFAGDRLANLMDKTFSGFNGEFTQIAASLGNLAFQTAFVLIAVFAIPVILLGLLVEFLQAGPVLSFEPIKPKMDHLNPAEGVKRMFSLDSLVETLKSVIKTGLMLLIGWWVLKAVLPDISLLLRGTPQQVGATLWEVIFKLLSWTIGIFGLVSILDAVYQRHSFIKKMRMSMRDIKQEVKESEGDPYIKMQRKQAHQEWSQASAAMAARDATVLVVNPTHVAIAIRYDRDECPVPTIAAKGEDHVARAMREAAEDASVPIVRNVTLARDLLGRAEVGDVIPRDLFDIIAEVILWARQVREDIAAMKNEQPAELANNDAAEKRRYAAPGEDLTRYPKPAG